MTRYVLRRLVLMIPVLIGIMTAVFLMLHLIPGDPAIAMAGEKASKDQIAAARKAFDDGPWPRMTPAERAEGIKRLSGAVQSRAQELADTIRNALERSERDDHGHCAHITRRARGEKLPTSDPPDHARDGRAVEDRPADAPRIEPVRLTVTGASRGRRTEILIDEQQVEVTNANFIVLFNLIAGALRSADRWVKEESLGSNGSKAIYRLKQELKPHVHKRIELAECEKGRSNYRLSPQVRIERVDCERLANHDEGRVRELAAEIAKMSNAASREHQSA